MEKQRITWEAIPKFDKQKWRWVRIGKVDMNKRFFLRKSVSEKIILEDKETDFYQEFNDGEHEKAQKIAEKIIENNMENIWNILYKAQDKLYKKNNLG